MGGGVSKNNSGHAPPPSPEQIIKVGHLSSNFQITFIIHQGAEAAGEIWPRHRPQTKTIKTLKNCAKFAETFTKKTLSTSGNFCFGNILSSAATFWPAERTFILEFPI